MDGTKQKIVDEICRLESEADEIKNDIRGHLPKSIFMPVDRRDLLEILILQDIRRRHLLGHRGHLDAAERVCSSWARGATRGSAQGNDDHMAYKPRT